MSFFVQVWLTTHAFLVTTFKISYLLHISGSIEDVALIVLVEAKLHGESKVIQRCFDDNNDDNKR